MVSFPLFVIAIIWLLYKAFSEKPCPRGHTYDMETAEKDRENGVSYSEWKKKYNRGDYWVSQKELEERQKAKEVIPGVVDIERYEADKKIFSAQFVEINRKAGAYMTIRKFT